jgi:hypothetical protein
MNSSTSSSKPKPEASSRHEWKVILVVLLAVAVCEATMRLQSSRYLDVQHRRALPEIAATLAEAPAPRLLFLGNSLTRNGIDVAAFEEELAKHGLRAGGIAKANPDATAVVQWRATFEHYFATQSPPPDCVVVSYVSAQLTDQVDISNRLTAKLIGGVPQWIDVLRHDVDSFDDGADLTMACLFQSVAYQENAKNRILGFIIPHFQEQRQRLNDLRRAIAAARGNRNGENRFSYYRLHRLIASLKDKGCRVVFSLMPLPEVQTYDPQLVVELQNAAAMFFDMRGVYPQIEGHFPDGYHMDETAARIYSQELAREFAKRMPEAWKPMDGPEL